MKEIKISSPIIHKEGWLAQDGNGDIILFTHKPEKTYIAGEITWVSSIEDGSRAYLINEKKISGLTPEKPIQIKYTLIRNQISISIKE